MCTSNKMGQEWTHLRFNVTIKLRKQSCMIKFEPLKFPGPDFYREMNPLTDPQPVALPALNPSKTFADVVGNSRPASIPLKVLGLYRGEPASDSLLRGRYC